MYRRLRITIALISLTVFLLLSGCSELTSLVQTNSNISLGNITGSYKSNVSEGEVKKVILYLRESAVIKHDEQFHFTLEKHPNEYRVVIDLTETDKFNLEDNPIFFFFELFGSTDVSELSEEHLQAYLFRSLAIGLTEDVLKEYTEVRVLDNEQKKYRIFPPSLQ